MTVGMIAKWFYDNNILVREDTLQDRLKQLVFTAACCLGLEEDFKIDNRKIIMDIKYEDYDLKEEVIYLLNCINRSVGYLDNYKDSFMFDSILIELGDNIECKYSDLNKYYLNFRNNILEEYDGYNFNKQLIRVGNNIYFINLDRELTNEEMHLLNEDQNQKILEVYIQDSELIFI